MSEFDLNEKYMRQRQKDILAEVQKGKSLDMARPLRSESVALIGRLFASIRCQVTGWAWWLQHKTRASGPANQAK
jgi:hypothetical protein